MTVREDMARPPELARLACMEVRGGNTFANTRLKMSGLDAWIYSRPYGGAKRGGDVHFVSSCDSGRILRVLVADVSGHGESVSRMAEQLRWLMQRYLNYLDQSRFIQMMNEKFTEMAQDGEFATAVVVSYFAPARRLTVSVAGHPPPLLWRASEGRWQALAGRRRENRRPENLPLGVVPITEYEQQTLHLERGDLILVYTDPLMEARRGDGHILGIDGLIELADCLDAHSPETCILELLERLEAESPENLDHDDMTLLLMRATGELARFTPSDFVLIPLRLTKAFVRGLMPGGPPIPWPEISRDLLLGPPQTDDGKASTKTG